MTRLAAALAVLLVGCGSGAPEGSTVTELAVATHRELGSGPAAIVGGLLDARDGCLVFVAPDGETVPVWPSGTRAWIVDGRPVVTDARGRVVVSVGEEAHFGGGTDYTRAGMAPLLGGPMSPACLGRARFMLINTLDRLAES